MFTKDDIKTIIEKQQKDLQKEEGVKRYLQVKLLNNYATIISGIRRCGKSTLIRQFLKNKKPIYYTNFEDLALTNFKLKDFTKLEEVFKELYPQKGIFFFDEIQNINGWEHYIRQLVDKGEKVIITGSNASMLSRELGTKLTGRQISLELFPFTYQEFLSIQKKEHSIDLFQKYLFLGGFPEYLKTEDKDILRNLLQDILYRDIVARNDIRNEAELKSMLLFLLSNIGKQVSFNKIKDLIKVKSTNTITQFMDYFEDAYLLFSIKKFDYSIKKQIFNPKKIYCVDNGIINENAFTFSENKGRILENTVFIELRRANKEIYYHKDKYECDFLVKDKLNISEAIQVCYEINPDNKEREIEGLLEAMEKHNLKSGLILTFNQEDKLKFNEKTMTITPIWKWILGKKVNRIK